MSDTTSKLILSLAKNVQELNAGNGHAKMNNIQHTKGLTAVVSVYNQEKPSYMVLDELIEWCENNGEDNILNKIKELASDMSWNDENPV